MWPFFVFQVSKAYHKSIPGLILVPEQGHKDDGLVCVPEPITVTDALRLVSSQLDSLCEEEMLLVCTYIQATWGKDVCMKGNQVIVMKEKKDGM